MVSVADAGRVVEVVAVVIAVRHAAVEGTGAPCGGCLSPKTFLWLVGYSEGKGV